jgi:phosphatidate cytidylyltransferase
LKSSVSQFFYFIVILSLIGLYEFYRMALPGRKIEGVFATISGTLFCVAIYSKDFMSLLLALTLFILTFGLILLLRIEEIKSSAGEVAILFLGVVYVPFLLTHLALLREVVYGVQWIFLLLIIVMSGDTAAYYAGRTLGKRKLARISPQTIGDLGGLVGSLAGVFIGATFFPQLSVGSIVLPLLLGVLGQQRLFESMLTTLASRIPVL